MKKKTRDIDDSFLWKKVERLRRSAEENRRSNEPGKRRLGVQKYLIDVYAVFVDLRSKRKAKRAARRIIKLANLSIRKKSHPIRVLIEASAGPEDNRAKSRWTQALRYIWGWKQRPDKVEWMFSVEGGIIGCAASYAFLRKAKKAEKARSEPPAISHSLQPSQPTSLQPSSGEKLTPGIEV